MQLQPLAATNATRRDGRHHHRVPYSVPIKLHSLMPNGIRSTGGMSLDICEGGVGTLVQSELMLGDVVEIDLHSPHFSLCVMAVVRHTSGSHSGLEFFELTVEERRQIEVVVGSR
jgi:hypothetical protein